MKFFFFIFLALNTMARNGDDGYKRVTEGMGLCARITATYVQSKMKWILDTFLQCKRIP